MALVVFLRGVNVGGHRTFRPSRLAEQLEPFGALNIGAAGTLVIRRRVPRARLRAEIARRLPFKAEIIICDGREVLRLASQNPMARPPASSGIIGFVSVLSKRPASEPSLPLRFPPTGQWLLRILWRQDRFVFGQYRRQMKVIRYLGALDRLFGVPVTTRNWNTIAAVADVLRRQEKD